MECFHLFSPSFVCCTLPHSVRIFTFHWVCPLHADGQFSLIVPRISAPLSQKQNRIISIANALSPRAHFSYVILFHLLPLILSGWEQMYYFDWFHVAVIQHRFIYLFVYFVMLFFKMSKAQSFAFFYATIFLFISNSKCDNVFRRLQKKIEGLCFPVNRWLMKTGKKWKTTLSYT